MLTVSSWQTEFSLSQLNVLILIMVTRTTEPSFDIFIESTKVKRVKLCRFPGVDLEENLEQVISKCQKQLVSSADRNIFYLKIYCIHCIILWYWYFPIYRVAQKSKPQRQCHNFCQILSNFQIIFTVGNRTKFAVSILDISRHTSTVLPHYLGKR